ncbi:MAG: N-acetyltransferase, partial [Anaerolineales bacterium]
MDNNPLVTLRPMNSADIPAGMRLKDIAGWNQTECDWEMILNTSLGGCYVAVLDDTVVGTMTTLTYGNRFSWLGMLLVAPEHRRQGIATTLLKTAIDFAKEYGPICLDATPAGAPLYRSLGFEDASTLIRMERPCNPHHAVTASAHAILNIDALKAVCAYDEPLFGADRSSILSS